MRRRVGLGLERRGTGADGDDLGRGRVPERPLLLGDGLHVLFSQKLGERLRAVPRCYLVFGKDVPSTDERVAWIALLQRQLLSHRGGRIGARFTTERRLRSDLAL